MEQDLNAVIRHWYDRTRTVEKAHFTRCALFRRRHVALGCVTIVSTSLLGVLSNLSPDHNAAARFASVKRRLALDVIRTW